MAIIWQKHVANKHYEVRKAGNSLRLYTDGVFHSQYNPHHPISRGVWDLLFLPAFFFPRGTLKRILVLGVGGGTVIHLLHRYVKPDHITAVDLDPVHLSVTKRFFGVNKAMAKLVRANAIDWLSAYKGQAFDMIIDDLFFEHEGEGQRAIALNGFWFDLLNRNLSKDSVLVINTFSMKELRQSAYCRDANIAASFKSAYTLRLPRFDNVVAAFLKIDSMPKILHQAIKRSEGLNAQSGVNRLQVSIRRLDTVK